MDTPAFIFILYRLFLPAYMRWAKKFPFSGDGGSGLGYAGAADGVAGGHAGINGDGVVNIGFNQRIVGLVFFQRYVIKLMPRSKHSATSLPTMAWASRKGIPLRTR